MGTPASGAISLNDIKTEFGGAAPYSLNEYYNADIGVPASGTIKLGDFYNKFRHGNRSECANAFNSVVTTLSTSYQGPLVRTIGVGNSNPCFQGTFSFTPTSINSTSNSLNSTQNTYIFSYSSTRGAALFPSPPTFKTINGTVLPPPVTAATDQGGNIGMVAYHQNDQVRFKELSSVVWNSGLCKNNDWGGVIMGLMFPNKWSVTPVITTAAAADGVDANVTLGPNDYLLVPFYTGYDWDGGYISGFDYSVPSPAFIYNGECAELYDGAVGNTPSSNIGASKGVVVAVGLPGGGYALSITNGRSYYNTGLKFGDAVKFSTTGTLPSPLNTTDIWYVYELGSYASGTAAGTIGYFNVTPNPTTRTVNNVTALVGTPQGTIIGAPINSGTHQIYGYTKGESLSAYLSVAGKWYQSGGIMLYRNNSTSTKTYRIPRYYYWNGPAFGLWNRAAYKISYVGDGYLNSTLT